MALETMDLHEVRSAMEGILFAAGEPVNIDRICLALELDKPTAEQVLQELGDYYAFERRGHPSGADGELLSALLCAGLRGHHPQSV